MNINARIDNAALKRTMRSLRKRLPKLAVVEGVVGYDVNRAPYAVFVHEDLAAYHPQGQAKFLEEPARTLQAYVALTFNKTFQSTRSMVRAMYSAALFLLEASLRLVPVDTGNLKASAFAMVIREEVGNPEGTEGS